MPAAYPITIAYGSPPFFSCGQSSNQPLPKSGEKNMAKTSMAGPIFR